MADLHLVLRDPANDELTKLLHEIREVLLRYPVASLATSQALVAEGRSFLATEEGQRWASRLASGELVRAGRLLWDSVSLGMLEEPTPSVLPSRLIELFALAIRDQGLEAMLAAFAGANR